MASMPEHQDRALPVLAVELRTALTPVLGYIDLILEAETEGATVHHLHWVGPIERQLHNLRRLSDELIDLCETWRNDGAGSGPLLERRPD
jgi:signal transduction histidine kinase